MYAIFMCNILKLYHLGYQILGDRHSVDSIRERAIELYRFRRVTMRFKQGIHVPWTRTEYWPKLLSWYLLFHIFVSFDNKVVFVSHQWIHLFKLPISSSDREAYISEFDENSGHIFCICYQDHIIRLEHLSLQQLNSPVTGNNTLSCSWAC